MTSQAQTTPDWLARGRAHQAAGRPVDALICYRRALRSRQTGADAQFHLGEIVWRLGRQDDAITAWRAAIGIAPAHGAAWHGLAEAYAATGDFDASADAAQHVLALHPGERRTSSLATLLAIARSDAADASGPARASVTVSDDALVTALDAGAAWPLGLLARVLERRLARDRETSSPPLPPTPDVMRALLAAVAVAGVSVDNVDALRRVAVALAAGGHQRPSQDFADRYAIACISFHRPRAPLLWPARTYGRALRIGVLVSGDAREFEGRPATDALDPRAEITWLALPGTEVDRGVPGDEVRTLPADPALAARAVGTLDLDLIVDLPGLRASTGPLLAQRPARSIWSLAQPEWPAATGLSDRRLAPEDWAAALSALHAGLTDGQAVEASIDCAGTASAPMPSAAELVSRFDDAVRAHQRGDVEAARRGYAGIIAVQPAHAPTRYLAGTLERDRGDAAAALRHLRSAAAAAPDYADAQIAIADMLLAQDAPEDALDIVLTALDAQSSYVALWRALARVETKRGEAAAAASAIERALRVDPLDGELHFQYGVALQTAHRSADAVEAYQRALALRPDLAAAEFNLGVICDEQGDAASAITAYGNALRQVPGHAAAYRALGDALLAAGRIDEWYANYERFRMHCPETLAQIGYGLEVCAYRADHAGRDRLLDALRRLQLDAGDPFGTLDALGQLLYLLLFFDVEPELIAHFARVHDALARGAYGEPLPRRDARQRGRIRVGYLSGDFRNHVMGKMIWPVLRRHDRTRFDILGYSTSDAQDEWTRRFVPLFSRMVPLARMSDAAAAARIAEDDLDILVDLSTHTRGARPGILALKPARVQITHVASAGTVGLSAIDYKLTDRYADVVSDGEAQIEAPLVMEGCVYPYRHVDAAPGAARAALGIASDAFVIGAFVTPLKLSQRCLALWREVMVRIPRAVLAFSPLRAELQPVLRHIATAAGIDPARVVFVPQGGDEAANQARYRVVDAVLDPMPYGGVNGTLEALDMEVPVVTLVGRRHGERSSYSILRNLGVTDTIAESGRDYVAIAQRLADDAGFMRGVRTQIAAGLAHSPLTDMAMHARRLEAAYVAALEARAPEALAGTAE